MTSIQRIAPRDVVKSFNVRIDGTDDDGNPARIDIPVEYYRNRITLAPTESIISDDDAKDMTDAEYDAVKSASTMCHYLKSWDLEGPLYDNRGNEIVGAHEPIPLDPRITMHVPTLVIGEIMRQLTEEVFPPTTRSRNERRRSR